MYLEDGIPGSKTVLILCKIVSLMAVQMGGILFVGVHSFYVLETVFSCCFPV
jgi:hypothetical protein